MLINQLTKPRLNGAILDLKRFFSLVPSLAPPSSSKINISVMVVLRAVEALIIDDDCKESELFVAAELSCSGTIRKNLLFKTLQRFVTNSRPIVTFAILETTSY